MARAQDLSSNFLVSILHDLRRAGLVESRRGSDGGFRLARSPQQIAVADVIEAIEGPLLSVRGESPEELRYDGAAEPLREVWLALRASVRSVVESVTIADLVARTQPEGLAV
jgi:Rrf2 family protein